MKRKAREGGLSLPDLKLYYKAAIIKTARYWVRNRGVDQWNKLGTQDTLVKEYRDLLFVPRTPASGIRTHCFTKIAGKTGK